MGTTTSLRGRLVPSLRWLQEHKYHVLFGASLFSLTILLGWWAVYMLESADRTMDDRQQILRLRIEVFASLLGNDPAQLPRMGVMDEDPDVLVEPCPDQPDPFSVPLSPYHSELCLRSSPEAVENLSRQDRRRHAMVLGESALALILVLVTGLMFYRLLESEKRAAQELQEIWSRVTHELKTPITGIKAMLQTLQNQELSREELEPLLKLAMREVDRQEKLAENLLIGQRLARGYYKLRSRPVDLALFVENYFKQQVIRLRPDQVHVTVDCAVGEQVSGDPNALRVILDNLVDNALKYGSQDLLLDVSVSLSATTGQVKVQDNGPGFNPKLSRKVFDAYRRLSDELPSSKQGTGMGLHISRRLALEMGGDLVAYSAGLGQGASFTLTLLRYANNSGMTSPDA